MLQEISKDNYKFVAKLGNLKVFVQLLKAVNFKETATCCATSIGLKVTVEDAKCMQASVYIPNSVFQEFTLNEESLMFKIDLNTLVECLCMFWGNINSQDSTVALQLCYKGSGNPVSVLIEEGGIITDCCLKTQEVDELLDFHLGPDDVLNKVVLQADLLKDVVPELDPSNENVELTLSPNEPYFQICTTGLGTVCLIELPHVGDYIDSFQCKAAASTYYKFSHIKPAIKALACASKVSIRTDICGLVCFQYMVKTEEGHICYIEYYICPIVDED